MSGTNSKVWYKDRYLAVLLLFVLAACAMMAALGRGEGKAPEARAGRMDLSGWDFDRQGSVPLNGQWAFYPNRLLAPADFAGDSVPQPGYLQVPAVWNGFAGMKAHGYGTYRLQVRIRPTEERLALQKKLIRFSSRIYLNGRLVSRSGVPATSRAASVPGNAPDLAIFDAPADGKLDLVVQVANYEYKSGGIVAPLTLGLERDLTIVRDVRVSLEWAGVTVLFIFSVLFLALYVLFKRHGGFLAFGLFFFFFGITIWFNGERTFMQLFPQMPFEPTWKVKDFSIFVTFPVLIAYSVRSFDFGAGRRALAALAIAYSAYCAAIAALPYRVYSQWLETFLYSFPAAYGLLFALLLRLYVQGQYGSFSRREMQLFMPAVACIALFPVNLFVYQGHRLASVGLTYFLILLFVALATVQLAYRYYRTYSSMVDLTRRLQHEDWKKDEFLLRTSHELNTPLHGIINISQSALEETLTTKAGRRVQEKMLTIRNIAFRMSHMVNDLIDLAKIKEGRLVVRLTEIDLAACVRTAFEVYGFLAKEKGIVLASAIDPSSRYARADESRFMQVLANLLVQCIRRSERGCVTVASRPAGTNVEIEIGCGEPDDSAAAANGRGEAADEGGEARPGADAEQDAFVRLRTAIELVRLMNGSLREAGSGRASPPRYVLLLPAATPERGLAGGRTPEAVPAAGEAAAALEEEAGERILVAGDLNPHLEWLSNVLALDGYRVATAHSDAEVLRIVDSPRSRPDLALLDVMLPGEGGFETGRRIRKAHSPMELPILFLMARSTPADVEAAIAAGGNDFVSKPLDAGELRMRIRTLLLMKRLVKEAAANEAAFLQSQIKPHFLYNALGTIMALCYTDGPRAGELLAVFSRYLRLVFHESRPNETVSLRKELELVRAYADIEKERFGQRLRVEIEADERLLQYPIPPLTLQPLVENAIRHGVAPKLDGGTVRLTIGLRDGQIRIMVEDDGVGIPADRLRLLREAGGAGGVGLPNIIKRVRHRTGRLPEILSVPGRGTRVTLSLPLAADHDGT